MTLDGINKLIQQSIAVVQNQDAPMNVRLAAFDAEVALRRLAVEMLREKLKQEGIEA